MTAEAEQPITPVEVEAGGDESVLVDALGKLALASIGAVSLAEEKAENLLRYLVGRGETDVQKARRMLGDVSTRRPRLRIPSRPRVAFATGNLATRADVQALEQRLDVLAAKLENLSQGPSEGL
jgi:polyhydroxyalkanoate synthesis regulator phasin